MSNKDKSVKIKHKKVSKICEEDKTYERISERYKLSKNIYSEDINNMDINEFKKYTNRIRNQKINNENYHSKIWFRMSFYIILNQKINLNDILDYICYLQFKYIMYKNMTGKDIKELEDLLKYDLECIIKFNTMKASSEKMLNLNKMNQWKDISKEIYIKLKEYKLHINKLLR